MNTPLFYREKPVFGFDLGHNSIKVMQIESTAKNDTVIGYGHIEFDPKAVKNGIIVDPEEVAKQVYTLITKHLVGSLEARRVAASLPVASTFSRILTLPKMDGEDLKQAILLEAGQYIPMPIEDLYIDYEIAHTGKDKSTEVLIVAAPKALVESYSKLFNILGLELALLETSINSVSRAVAHADNTGIPTLIIDFGSVSSDLSVFDKTVRVTGTVEGGGETITDLIAKDMGVTKRQAYTIKTRYGLNAGKKQDEVLASLNPLLKKLLSEIKKMTRFYEDRASTQRKIEQIIILGGGANLPGLSAYLTDKVRLPTRLVDPWQNLAFGNLQPPHKLETTLYTTAAGLALADPKEIKND